MLRPTLGKVSDQPLVPATFEPPLPPEHPSFLFEPLGPEHNESDLAAWSTSMEFIHSLPGWERSTWPPRVYTLEENLADLARHRDHHLRRLDFAWTVLDPRSREVIGCVYLRPDRTGEVDAKARSWTTADRADLAPVLREHLRPWWREAWPLEIRAD